MANDSDFEELPDDFEEVKETRHAPPREHSDAELGIESGPVGTSITKAGPVTLAIPKLFEALSPEEKKKLDADFVKFLVGQGALPSPSGKNFMDNPANREIVGQVVGSAVIPVGESIGAPIGRKIAGAGMEAAKKGIPRTIDAISKAIEHSKSEAGKLHIAHALGQDVAAAGKGAAVAAAKGVSAIGPGAGTYAGGRAAMPEPGAPPAPKYQGAEAKPYQGVFSNAIERLRASAAGNPRAAELLARIDGAGPMNVEQGTAGEIH